MQNLSTCLSSLPPSHRNPQEISRLPSHRQKAASHQLSLPPVAKKKSSLAVCSPQAIPSKLVLVLLVLPSLQQYLTNSNISPPVNIKHLIYQVHIAAEKRHAEAVTFLEDAVKKVPESLVLKVSLARGYQQRKDYEKALALCNAIIAEYPNQLDALVLKALYLTRSLLCPIQTTSLILSPQYNYSARRSCATRPHWDAVYLH